MKRNLFAALVVSLAITAPAFASGGGGIGRAGTYGQTPVGASTVSRAEVKAEIVTAYRDGSLPSLNKTTYPSLSLEGQRQAELAAAQSQGDNSTTRVARGE